MLLDGSRMFLCAIYPRRIIIRKTVSRRLATKVGRPDTLLALESRKSLVFWQRSILLRLQTRESTLNRCLAVSIFRTSTFQRSRRGKEARRRGKGATCFLGKSVSLGGGEEREREKKRKVETISFHKRFPLMTLEQARRSKRYPCGADAAR